MGAAAGSFLLSGTAAMAQTELTFWSWRQEDKAFYQDVIKKFQAKELGITVKFETCARELPDDPLHGARRRPRPGRDPGARLRQPGDHRDPGLPARPRQAERAGAGELPGSSARGRDPALGRQGLCRSFAMQAQLVVYNKKIFKDAASTRRRPGTR